MTATGPTITAEREQRRRERAIVAPYRGMFEWRIVAEFAVSAAAWIAVLTLGFAGTIPLWLGLVLNAAVAATFYMPLHEATHGNIWGTSKRWRGGEDVIGMLSGIPLAFSYKGHRLSHMHHHAYTNDPRRDPDLFVAGSLWGLPYRWFVYAMVASFLPVLAAVPPSRRLIPKAMAQKLFATDVPPQANRYSLVTGLISYAVLIAGFVLGVGWELLLLWYLPARLALFWLLFVFAWYPHHPHQTQERYRDTRVAVFPGSTLLIRGHDHHLLHHLYPRVAHYRLPALWADVGPMLIEQGARVEGKAKPAPSDAPPVRWRA